MTTCGAGATSLLAVQDPESNGCSLFAFRRIHSEGCESQFWLAVLNGSDSDQLEPLEEEAVEKANTTKIQELLGQL